MKKATVHRNDAAGLVLAVACLVCASAVVRANGTIDTSGSEVGTGGAPQQGTVTSEPCAAPGPAPAMPSIGTLGATLGTMTGAVPTFPGGGTGSLGDFHATSDATLAGGTYEFASYAVDANVLVRYSDAVVIRTTGNVVLDGQIVVDVGGLEFDCAGDFTVRAQSATTVPGAQTSGGPMKFDVAGVCSFIDISVPGSSAISDFGTQGQGDIVVIGRGGPTAAPMTVNFVALRGRRVSVQSATGLTMSGARVDAFDGGGASLSAFGGDFNSSASESDCSGPFVIEASGAARVGTWSAYTRQASATYTAFGGPLVVTGGSCQTTLGGDILLHGATDAELRDGAHVEIVDTGGTVEMTAFDGDVKLQSAAASPACLAVNSGTGPVSLSASGAMTLAGAAQVKASGGDVTLRAFGGGATISGTVNVNSAAGPTDIAATGGVSAFAGGDIRIDGDSVRIVGNEIDLTTVIVADAGPIALTSHGAVHCAGAMQSAGNFTATAITGDVVFDDCHVSTVDDFGPRSGDIRMESYAGASAGRVRARRAILTTGSNATASGDIVLRVVTVPRPTVTTYLLPNVVTLKLGTKKGSGVSATGTLGRPGGWPAPATSPFVLDVGTRRVAGDLALKSNRRDREYKAPGVLLRVTPPRTGTSKGAFTLRIDGDLTGVVPSDGLVDFRLVLDGVEFAGTVRLVNGKFKLGSTRGAVTELLYPRAVAATLKGGGKDVLTFTVGFATDGTTPDAVTDVGLSFGDTFAATVAAADFVKSKDRFTAKNPPSAPGLSLVTVDFRAETVTVKGKNLDLGAFPTTASVASRIGVTFGSDIRTVDFAMSRKGTKLTY